MRRRGDENDAHSAAQNDERSRGLQKIRKAHGGGGDARDDGAERQDDAENQAAVDAADVVRPGCFGQDTLNVIGWRLRQGATARSQCG